MKIICKDNFDRESVSDRLIADNVPPFYAKDIADALNAKHSGESSPLFFAAVSDEYKLRRFEP